MRLAAPSEVINAKSDLSLLRNSWQVVQPFFELRDQAESFVDSFQLKAADAQQLAAAFIWADRDPKTRVFLSGDLQLLNAAQQLGFLTIQI
jgi:hypothetical protein